jgi:hypothetical protein
MSERVIGAKILVDASQAAAEFKKTQEDVKQVGAAAQTGSAAASSAMQGFEKAASGASASSAQMLLRQQQLGQEMNRLNATIKAESASLDLMQRVSARSAEAQALLTGKIQESENALLGLLGQKQSLSEEANVLSGALNKTGEATENSSSGFGKLTSQVRTSGTIFEGFDPIVTAVAASLGGVTVGTAVLFSVLGSLAKAIFSTGEAKKEENRLDKEALAVQAERLRLMREEASQRSLVTEQMFRQIKAQKEIFDALFQSAVKAVIDQMAKLETKQKEINESQNKGIAAQAKLGGEYATARKELDPLVEVLFSYQKVTNSSTGDTVDHARQIGFFSNQTDLLRQAFSLVNPKIDEYGNRLGHATIQLRGTTQATREFNDELNKLKLPASDVALTKLGRGELQAQLEQKIAQQLGDKTTGETRFEANLPALNRMIDLTRQAIRAEAELSGQFIKEAEIERQLREAFSSRSTAVKAELSYEIDAALRLEGSKKREAEALAATNKARQEALQHEKALSEKTIELSKQAELAKIKIELEGFDERRALIVKNFEFEKAALKQKHLDTKENLNAIRVIELEAITELEKEKMKLYGEEKVKQMQFLEKQREDRQRMQDAELKDLRTHLSRQRQLREEEERKFLEDQAKLELAARSDKPGRKLAEIEQLAKDAAAIDRVRGGFDQTTHAGRALDEMIKNIALDGQQGFQGIGSAVVGLAQDLFSVANIANSVGNAIGNAFESAISGTESFGHSLTKAVLTFIATIAQQFGALFILIGSGLIWLGWPGGGALIGYGIALEALAGVLRGVAGRIGNDSPQQSIAASGAGGSSATSATISRDRQPIRTAFPTSPRNGGPSVVNVHLDGPATRGWWDDQMERKGMVSVSTAKGRHNQPLKAALGVG